MSKLAVIPEPVARISREEYRAWVASQPIGRHERVNGVVLAIAPERVAHARVKARTWQALDRAIRTAGVACEALPDGMTVEVDDSDYEPDAVVQCGPKLPGDVNVVPNPVIIVEVLSPSTSGIDRAWKLQAYFRLASLRHYLIIWADQEKIAHHRRGDDGEIETHTLTDGEITLDPPGITISVSDIYPT